MSRSNEISPGVRVGVKPDKRWSAFAMYRALWLANRTDSFGSTGVRDATGQSGRFAGQQLEASASYWLMPKVAKNGRASCRERVWQYVSIDVVAVQLNNKKVKPRSATKHDQRRAT